LDLVTARATIKCGTIQEVFALCQGWRHHDVAFLQKECCVMFVFVWALAAASPAQRPQVPHRRPARPPLILSLPNASDDSATPEAKPPVRKPVEAPPPTRAPLPYSYTPPLSAPRKACARGCLTPVEAVTFADTVAPKAGIAGEFDLTIASVGERQGRYYLNSEEDYRERNCLSVVLAPEIAQALVGKPDLETLAVRMKGKRIAVQGVARRVRIDLTDRGQATGSYYYQVHVVVTDARQIAPN
jgi:hypothetical protein